MRPMDFGAISFPFLGIEINPPRSFDLGPLTVHLYGLIGATALMLMVLYACKRSPEFGLNEDIILDGVLWITPFAIACARAYYVAFSWDSYKDNLISVLYIWEGGIAVYGSIIGVVLGIFLLAKVKKVRAAAILDVTLMCFLFGQAAGRWGNFFNREAFGAATDSFFRMGLFNTRTGAWEYYHPTFLYESLWNLAGFFLLTGLASKRKYDGQIALGYAAWYGLGRTFIEGLRVDSLWWGPFRVSQVLAAVTCLLAAGVLLWQMTRPHDPANLFVNQVKAQQEKP